MEAVETSEEEEEEEDGDDDNSPENDPDVQDINWFWGKDSVVKDFQCFQSPSVQISGISLHIAYFHIFLTLIHILMEQWLILRLAGTKYKMHL